MKRPLAYNELRGIFLTGLKGKQLADIASMNVKSVEQDFMDTTEKAGIGK